MDKHTAEELAHEINAARPQTHRGGVMWDGPSEYVVDCRCVRTLERVIFRDRDQYLAARARELKKLPAPAKP